MSNSEQFCLRWNNHQSTLVSVFENLLDSNVLIDCTLCAEGKFLKAHRVVLSACSPIFKDMMAIQEDKHPIVFLNDVSFLEMRAMLDYMYKGEVNILQDQLDSFLRTAAALQIKGLTDQGGGGTDEPPAKKGPGRKTGMSDAPESPLVGNAPLREGSMSPTRRRRRVPRRPDSADDQSAENSCDIPSAPQTGSLAPAPSSQSALSSANQSSLSAADLMHHGPASSTPNSASRLPPVRKHEPIDQTQVVKQEYVEEPQEDIEDLTLDDDEDYNDNMSTVSDMAKPGTSFHHSQSNQGDFGVDWNPIMANQSGTDDVFLRATEAINNQSTTQASAMALARLTCPKCGKVFRHYQNLWTHRKYVCGVAPKFSCHLCSYKAKLKVCLKQHYMNKHRDAMNLPKFFFNAVSTTPSVHSSTDQSTNDMLDAIGMKMESPQ